MSDPIWNKPILNFTQGGDIRVNLFFALIVPYVLAGIALGLRMWSRRLSGTKYGWDDALICLSFLVSTAEFAVFSLALHLGSGRPFGPAPESKIKKYFVVVFILEIFYGATMFLTRASALVLWSRLFQQKEVRWYCRVWRVINILWFLGELITTCLQCQPTWMFWSPFADAHNYFYVCKVNIRTFFIAVASSGIIVDVAIIILPLVLCWRLNLNRSTKILVCGMFATSFFVTIVSGVRLHTILVFNLADISETLNATWTFANVGGWSVVETNVGILSACLPCLRPAVAKLVPKTLVPKSLQKHSFDPLSTGARQRRRDGEVEGAHNVDSNDDTLINGESQLEKSQSGGDFVSGGRSSSERHDTISDAESGIMEIAPGVMGSASWLNVRSSTGINTDIHAQDGGHANPRHGVILVEHSVHVSSERHSLAAEQE